MKACRQSTGNKKQFWNTVRGLYILNDFPIVKAVFTGHNSTTALEGQGTETPYVLAIISHSSFSFPKLYPPNTHMGTWSTTTKSFWFLSTKEGNVLKCASQVTLSGFHNTHGRKHKHSESGAYSQRQMLCVSVKGNLPLRNLWPVKTHSSQSCINEKVGSWHT